MVEDHGHRTAQKRVIVYLDDFGDVDLGSSSGGESEDENPDDVPSTAPPPSFAAPSSLADANGVPGYFKEFEDCLKDWSSEMVADTDDNLAQMFGEADTMQQLLRGPTASAVPLDLEAFEGEEREQLEELAQQAVHDKLVVLEGDTPDDEESRREEERLREELENARMLREDLHSQACREELARARERIAMAQADEETQRVEVVVRAEERKEAARREQERRTWECARMMEEDRASGLLREHLQREQERLREKLENSHMRREDLQSQAYREELARARERIAMAQADEETQRVEVVVRAEERKEAARRDQERRTWESARMAEEDAASEVFREHLRREQERRREELENAHMRREDLQSQAYREELACARERIAMAQADEESRQVEVAVQRRRWECARMTEEDLASEAFREHLRREQERLQEELENARMHREDLQSQAYREELLRAREWIAMAQADEETQRVEVIVRAEEREEAARRAQEQRIWECIRMTEEDTASEVFRKYLRREQETRQMQLEDSASSALRDHHLQARELAAMTKADAETQHVEALAREAAAAAQQEALVAAVKLQAAMRGSWVRQRLKASLNWARQMSELVDSNLTDCPEVDIDDLLGDVSALDSIANPFTHLALPEKGGQARSATSSREVASLAAGTSAAAAGASSAAAASMAVAPPAAAAAAMAVAPAASASPTAAASPGRGSEQLPSLVLRSVANAWQAPPVSAWDTPPRTAESRASELTASPTGSDVPQQPAMQQATPQQQRCPSLSSTAESAVLESTGGLRGLHQMQQMQRQHPDEDDEVARAYLAAQKRRRHHQPPRPPAGGLHGSHSHAQVVANSRASNGRHKDRGSASKSVETLSRKENRPLKAQDAIAEYRRQQEEELQRQRGSPEATSASTLEFQSGTPNLRLMRSSKGMQPPSLGSSPRAASPKRGFGIGLS